MGFFLSNNTLFLTNFKSIKSISECSKEEIEELISHFEHEYIQQNSTIMTLDEDRICGLAFNKADKVEHLKTSKDFNMEKSDFTKGK